MLFSMITAYISDKLRFFSLLGMLLVVLLHSFNAQLLPECIWTWRLQCFVSNGICRIAVPLFFVISGFLFWTKFTQAFSRQDYFRQIQRRFFSLAVPYLLWAGAGLVFCLICQKVLLLDIGAFKFTNSLDLIYYWLWNPRLTYQLWFLRELFLLTLCAPVIYIALQCRPYVFLLVLGLLVVLSVPFFVFGTNSLLYFVLGSFLALRQRNWLQLRLPMPWLLAGGVVWLAACIYSNLGSWTGLPILLRDILGIVVLWMLYDAWHIDRWIKYVQPFFVYTFLLYLLHEPLLSLIRKSIWAKAPHEAFILNLLYWGLPILVSGITVAIGMTWRKVHLKSFQFATGNRG